MMARRDRGWAAQAAMMVVLGAAVVVIVGLWARQGDLRFERMSLCRVRAHWAAEAAVARAQAQLEQGYFPSSVRGSLPSGDSKISVVYWLKGEREGRSAILRAAGACRIKGERPVEKRLRVGLAWVSGTTWRVVQWEEGPFPPEKVEGAE